VLPLPHEFSVAWIVDSLAPDEMEHLEACAGVQIAKAMKQSASRQSLLMLCILPRAILSLTRPGGKACEQGRDLSPNQGKHLVCLSGTEIPEIADGHTKGIDR
jgi:hypothetical protein